MLIGQPCHGPAGGSSSTYFIPYTEVKSWTGRRIVVDVFYTLYRGEIMDGPADRRRRILYLISR